MPPLKLAIIGGGPSAFYVASRLLQTIGRSHPHDSLRIHIYDRLWSPHGLVRYGVAPDHPEVKARLSPECIPRVVDSENALTELHTQIRCGSRRSTIEVLREC